MRRSFKFLLRPTARQETALAACVEDHRQLYNAALQERRDAWRMRGETVRYGGQSAQLKAIRAADPDHSRWSFSSQQATLRRLDKAMAAFFRRVKAGRKPGYPRFKGANWFDTVVWPADGDGCRWDSQPGHPTATYVRLQGVGHVRVHRHRPVPGTVKTIGVKREGDRWHVVLSCDDVPAGPLPATGAAVGVDMGTVHFLTTSDGRHVENPKYGKVAAAGLADAQQALAAFPRVRRASRTVKHRRAAGKVARLHRKVRRQRLDHAHKTALALVRGHDFIAVEALPVGNMVRAPKAKPDPDAPGAYLPNGAAAKAGLNRSILDAGWGVFLRVLACKAESAGRVVVAVNPANTSRTCAACGHCAEGNRVSQAEFRCLGCGHTAHADVNAAQNVLGAGLVLRDAQAA